MLFKASKDITLVIYQDQVAPRCYEIKKNLVTFFTFAIPIISTTCVLIVIFGSLYFKSLRDTIKSHEPKIIAELKTEVADLKKSEKGFGCEFRLKNSVLGNTIFR